MKHIFLALLMCSVSVYSIAQTSLNRTDSVKIDQANIWGVLAESDQVDRMALTVSRGNIIYFQYIDENLERITDQVAVYGEDDNLPKIVDHKTVFWKDHYFITFSSAGDKQLYLVKIDKEGKRVGEILEVYNEDDQPANQPGKPTNDMIMIATDETLFVGHFIPGSQHYIHSFDENLNRTKDPFNTDISLEHNNVGGGLYINEKIHLFTGNLFGGDSDLILTEWDKDFEPAANSPRTLIESDTDHANWFATGVAYDPATEYWYVGFQHLYPGQVLDSEHIDLAVFDKCFNLIDRVHVTELEYFRPHLLIHNDVLYLAYDKRGQGVFMHKYDLLEEGLGSSECDDSNDDDDDDGEQASLIIDNDELPENESIGTQVGELGISNSGETSGITYSFTSGEGDTDNSAFSIDGTNLLSAKVFDFEVKSSYNIRVRASNGKQSIEGQFTITIQNVIEHELATISNLVFGTVTVGESKTLQLEISNNGQDDGLEVTNISVPPRFTVSQTSFSINSGETKSVDLTFEPLTNGDFNGSLTINANSGDTQVSLSASGEVITSTVEDLNEDAISVYPNPSSSIVNVEIFNQNLLKAELRLFNGQGEVLLFRDSINTRKLSLNVSGYQKGIYFLILRSQEGVRITKKVLVK